jgi:hypothetical protein
LEPLADCTGVVETAIAAALKLAAEARQWEVVIELARDLALRREAKIRHNRPPVAVFETDAQARAKPP